MGTVCPHNKSPKKKPVRIWTPIKNAFFDFIYAKKGGKSSPGITIKLGVSKFEETGAKLN